MNPKIIDISVPVQEGMPVWPKSPGINLARSQIKTDLHVGTHIDAPLHFISKGASVDKMGLDKLVGRAAVVYLPRVKTIGAKDLEKLNLPQKTTRLLFKTSNSSLWQKKFQKDFVGLTPDAALWLVKRGIELTGIDYLSIARYRETVKVHRILLKNKVVILESLNLAGVKPGIYQLICLPLKLIGTEAALARALLLPL